MSNLERNETFVDTSNFFDYKDVVNALRSEELTQVGEFISGGVLELDGLSRKIDIIKMLQLELDPDPYPYSYADCQINESLNNLIGILSGERRDVIVYFTELIGATVLQRPGQLYVEGDGGEFLLLTGARAVDGTSEKAEAMELTVKGGIFLSLDRRSLYVNTSRLVADEALLFDAYRKLHEY